MTEEEIGDHCIVGRHRDVALVPQGVKNMRATREIEYPPDFSDLLDSEERLPLQNIFESARCIFKEAGIVL